MLIIYATLAFAVLRYFEVSFFASLSWWWLAALVGFAFVWFEFIEPFFGWDKKRAHDEFERNRQKRIKEAFSKKTPPRK